MNPMTTFDSTKEALTDMLKSIQDAKTQLPDFQRSWIWDDNHIKSLLVSVSLSYPIGAVMMLQTGNAEVRFKPRLLEGVTVEKPTEPDRFILDGQQRLTSLFQSLYYGKVVETKDTRGNNIRRWYYMNITKALTPNGDRDEAIISIPEDRKTLNFRGEVEKDYSTPEKEYEADLFPLAQVFDSSEWRRGYNTFWKYDKEKSKLFDLFEKEIIKRFEQYQIPLIELRKETPKDAVCQVFEKVNTGGVSLTVFELLTATYAIDSFNLRDDWAEREKRLKKNKVLSSIESTDFLQTISLLVTRAKRLQNIADGISHDNLPGISCKRKEVLRLTLNEYKTWAEAAIDGFEKAAKILISQKIFNARDIPYGTQITPLAAILAMLKDRADNDGVKAKLIRWYWCGIFGELYGGANETRFAKDFPEVLAWIDGGNEPSSIGDSNFTSSRLLKLRTRNSAAYKGLYAILLRDGCQDFKTGEPIDVQMYFDDKIDIHHIFPQDWCNNNNAKHYDSIVNKTPLAAKTNRIISGNPPSNYLARIQKSAGIDETRMDNILSSHVIDPTSLRSDNYVAFFKARETALLDRIEKAMGKPISRETNAQDFDVMEEQEEKEDED